MTGPFAGMRYVEASVWSMHLPKLLGVYEAELQGVIAEICQEQFERIVDIGAAEGYYAIGLAWRMPHCHVIAFEMEPEGRELLRELATLNGVQKRVQIEGLCDAPSLARSVNGGKNTLVVMDVEGAETVLLDPFVAPGLRQACILVELHDFVYREVGELITRRFEPTHTIVEILQRERTINDFPVSIPQKASKRLRRTILAAMAEGRPESMRWFYLKPRTK